MQLAGQTNWLCVWHVDVIMEQSSVEVKNQENKSLLMHVFSGWTETVQCAKDEDFAPQEHFYLQSMVWLSFLCYAIFQMCRSAEARTAAASLQEDMGLMLGWLDKADTVLAAPLHPAEPQHIRNTLSKVQVPMLLQPAV